MSVIVKVDYDKEYAAIKRKRSALFRKINKCSKEIEGLGKRIDYAYEDRIYRFYHYSFKIYWLQEYTEEILKIIQKINPNKDKHLCDFYTEILKDGTGKEFQKKHNNRWTFHTRPIAEAFFHSKYFLDMLLKIISLKKEQKEVISSGWAALLELYDIR